MERNGTPLSMRDLEESSVGTYVTRVLQAENTAESRPVDNVVDVAELVQGSRDRPALCALAGSIASIASSLAAGIVVHVVSIVAEMVGCSPVTGK